MKQRKSENSYLKKAYLNSVYFGWCIMPDTTVCKHIRKFPTLHCCNLYISNMAAHTVVCRMTP